jgi:cysteine desulfuration protein SufE
MTLSAKQETLISDLNLIDDPHEKLAVAVGKAASRSLTDAQKIDANRVAGCVSRVWLVGTHENGVCRFESDADSPMVKGLVALLCDLYSNATPAEAGLIEPEIWNKCGFERLLSPTRLNGLKSVRARIRELALEMHTSSPSAG